MSDGTDDSGSDGDSNRRGFLKTLGAISATTAAGCLGDDSDEDTPTDTATGGETPTDTPDGVDTPGETETDTPGGTDTPGETDTDTDTDTPTPEPDVPNVVLIMIDDMGYGDTSVEPFTSEKFGEPIPTPNLERMAENGTRFTAHYNGPAPSCTPSRTAVLTGSYHSRAGVHNGVYFPGADTGLHPDETTIAEVVGEEDYATGFFGKWHLGHEEPFLPVNQGFDESYVAPYSNDMSPPIPLIDGLETVTTEAPNEEFTQRYTDRATQFIRDHQDEPFFLYVPHTMVHVPIDVPEEFAGETGMGTYPDAVHELDWSTGQILDTLEELGLEENTLVVFTSDDGPWLSYGEDAGSAGPLRNGKLSLWEGGARVPTIMQMPGTIPAGTTCEEMTSHIDFLPTIANLAEADLPEATLDGKDITGLLENPESASTPHDYLMYYNNGQNMQAVRNAEGFKYWFGSGNLYDLEADIDESEDVSGANPEVVSDLRDHATSYDDQIQSNAREPGSLSNVAYLAIDSVTRSGGTSTVTFTNNRDVAVSNVEVSVSTPEDGVSVETTSTAGFALIQAGGSFDVDISFSDSGGSDVEEAFVTATATYQLDGEEHETRAGERIEVTTLEPLPEKYATFTNGSDAPIFGTEDGALVVSGTGGVAGDQDDYKCLYLDDSFPSEATATVKLTDVEELNEFSTGGLIVRNDITQSGESGGYALMSANSQTGELKRDTSGDGLIEIGSELTTFGGENLPRWLRFERSGTTFTASHSSDGSNWTEVETFELAGANDVQDVGLCVTGSTDQNHTATFEEFEVTTST
jgi:arylsulfatase/arylsulfatase A